MLFWGGHVVLRLEVWELMVWKHAKCVRTSFFFFGDRQHGEKTGRAVKNYGLNKTFVQQYQKVGRQKQGASRTWVFAEIWTIRMEKKPHRIVWMGNLCTIWWPRQNCTIGVSSLKKFWLCIEGKAPGWITSGSWSWYSAFVLIGLSQFTRTLTEMGVIVNDISDTCAFPPMKRQNSCKS